MRPAAVALLALVCAAAGGAVALVLGAAAGWVGPARTATIVAPAPEPPRTPPPVRAARVVPRDGFDPAALYERVAPGVVTVYATFASGSGPESLGQGSGFVVSADGVLLTNAHVVTEEDADGSLQPAREVHVEFGDGDRVGARIVGWDDFDDVAVLRVDPRAHRLVPVPLGDSARVVVGEPVAVIGSPFGEQNSLSVGVVSATERSIRTLSRVYRLADAIQTDAPVNRGNSGGPLLDARGRAIGINAQIRSESGTAEGVAFAVPINAAKRSLEEILERGRVSYAYLGVSAETLSPGVARRLGIATRQGALIVRVNEGPARAAGLRGGTRTVEVAGREVTAGGDVVVAVGREPIRSSTDLVRVVSERLRPGDLATITIVRGRERLRLPVRLAERPAEVEP